MNGAALQRRLAQIEGQLAALVPAPSGLEEALAWARRASDDELEWLEQLASRCAHLDHEPTPQEQARWLAIEFGLHRAHAGGRARRHRAGAARARGRRPGATAAGQGAVARLRPADRSRLRGPSRRNSIKPPGLLEQCVGAESFIAIVRYFRRSHGPSYLRRGHGARTGRPRLDRDCLHHRTISPQPFACRVVSAR